MCSLWADLSFLPEDFCLKASKEKAEKDISTVTPQMISVLSLYLGCSFHIVGSSSVSQISVKVSGLFSVYILILQPVVTLFIYSFYLPKIRESCKTFLLKSK